jgi:hypothetical protein
MPRDRDGRRVSASIELSLAGPGWADLAAQLRMQHPEITQAKLARQLGISATRLREVHKADVRTELPPPINDRKPTVPSEVSS